ncbi:capsular polysaccharide biosynthesis protein [Paenibacillus sp. V4I3]|uniref:YveK family protein n=1 Tax=unclassified Paenibacillus TaxID=185978 RepID=UPI00278AF1FA|nr:MULTISPECIES: Wzz/FepE/Etk N-terminal domain-containing protein [unclassified Paenibacillus]MDQ0873205.1 capsular polysaccharide biosynthesis protein [Paenibacillus sp. V4I3]MDQ0890878.1 capsular polysaccharide biosynthesis protein [Paenibacillus sp. V4I9]
MELIDILRILQKRLIFIIFFVLIVSAGAGLLGKILIKPEYEASTKLIVNKINNQEGEQGLDMAAVTANIMLMGSYKEIIKTPAIMEKVAQDYPALRMTAKELIDRVEVSSANNSQVMSITIDDRSYDRAASIVNAVAKVSQTEIRKIMSVDNISILYEAPLNKTPVSKQMSLSIIVAASFVVSLICSIGIAFLLELLDDRIQTEADIEKVLSIPALAVISRIKSKDLKQVSLTTERKEGEHTYVKAIH